VPEPYSRFDEQEAMMRGDDRRPLHGPRSNERVAASHGMKFAAAILLVITTAIAAGLFVGLHFGK
jgi:hypothetical protein